MTVNTVYPKFSNECSLLYELILEKMTMFLDKYVPVNIARTRVIDQINKEFKYIVDSGIAGLYYLITKTFDDAYVDRTEIITYGSSSGAVIPNLLELTGVGVGKRIRGIFAEQPIYFPELFYGLKPGQLEPNPCNIRISEKAYHRVIRSIYELLKESENYSDISLRDLYDRNILTGMGLYISANDELMLSDLESLIGYRHSCIPTYDKETMDIFYYGAYNSFDTYDDDFSFKVQIPIIDWRLSRKISEAGPLSLEDISKAISAVVMKNDYYLGNAYFREEYLYDCIKNSDIEMFEELRDLCIEEQIFPRVHIDSLVEICWQMAYYQVHFIRRKKL